jgi:hypothetical protein
MRAVDYRLGDWYHAADVSFPLVFLFDGLSAAVSLLVAVPAADRRRASRASTCTASPGLSASSC